MIALWTLCPGDVSAEYASSALALAKMHASDPIPRIRVTGPALAAARNDVVQAFLAGQPQCDWLLMVDADTGFPVNMPSLLLAAAHEFDARVVGAVCPVDADHADDCLGKLNCYERRDGGLVRCEPFTGAREVAAIGAGILAVHRDALLNMLVAPGLGPRWFGEVDDHGYHYGEDIGFCLRARAIGERVVAVHVPGVIHVKRRPIRLPNG